jgi:excisionase family DNA binding protein
MLRGATEYPQRKEATMLLDLPSAAADLGGIGISTLRRMIARGDLPIVRLGRRVLIRREALEELIAEQAKLSDGTEGTTEGLRAPA